MNILRQLWRRHKDTERQNEIKELRSRFSIEDRNGRMWLTLDGTAFAIMDKDNTAEQMSDMLEGCRRAAMAHRYGIEIADDDDSVMYDGITILNTN